MPTACRLSQTLGRTSAMSRSQFTRHQSVFFCPLLFLPLMVSAIYFWQTPKGESLLKRVLLSCHGLVIAALIFWTLNSHLSGEFRHTFGSLSFGIVMWASTGLSVASLVWYRGHPATHGLQFINLGALFALYFAAASAFYTIKM